ncbi:uncharacterized protein CMU_042010 [Cryptosporidium muris RN66]|uniref:Uncharacterized protein n=1 Tax=Cryptosporidium muris (strain RN66) TaxID=441375 RepID=B6AA87_CRYMR|nr:uncharacterized protein CMU_042010 [Cryptosporidium muris RN66]EEA05128.1 hypothetical protein, conserved [Cryptosporidium muris RN66]|eukprot:XP_002139477.1 hypothetical protein [Cryptosporidium muris RN66]
MFDDILLSRRSPPENGLPLFKQSYNIPRDCLGYRASIKMTRLHDSKRKHKIYSIDWICSGDKLLMCNREAIQVVTPQFSASEISIQGQWYKAIPSYNDPNQFLGISLNKPTIELHDTRTKTNMLITIPSDNLLNVAWSHNGKMIVSADRTDCLYSIDIRYAKDNILPMQCTRYSHNSYSYDITSQKSQTSYNIQSRKDYSEEINSLCFDKDDKYLIIAKNDGYIDFIDLKINRDISDINNILSQQVHLFSATLITESSNYLASFGSDQSLVVIDLNKLSTKSTMTNIDGNITTMSFNFETSMLSAGISSDKKKNSDIGESLIIMNKQLDTLSSFDIPGRIVDLTWHPYRNILTFACNAFELSNISNGSITSLTNQHNKQFCSGLVGPNIPFIGFLTIE